MITTLLNVTVHLATKAIPLSVAQLLSANPIMTVLTMRYVTSPFKSVSLFVSRVTAVPVVPNVRLMTIRRPVLAFSPCKGMARSFVRSVSALIIPITDAMELLI